MTSFSSFLIFFFIISKSSALFADIALAFHMDRKYYDQTTVDEFKKFLVTFSSSVALGSAVNDSRMALILGKSYGRTSVVVPLFNGTSSQLFADLEKSNQASSYEDLTTFFKSSDLDVKHDVDPIMERVKYSVFDGRRERGGDRLEAPNFRIIFIAAKQPATRTEAQKWIEDAKAKGADVVVTSILNANNKIDYDFGDWNNDTTTTDNDADSLAKKVFASLTNACDFEIKLQPCHHVKDKTCPCIRSIGFEIDGKSKNRKYCPINVIDAPCDEKDCPEIQLTSPRETWEILMLVLMIFVLSNLLFWPVCCFGCYFFVKSYTPVLIQMVIDEADIIAREQLANIKSKGFEKSIEEGSAVAADQSEQGIDTSAVKIESEIAAEGTPSTSEKAASEQEASTATSQASAKKVSKKSATSKSKGKKVDRGNLMKRLRAAGKKA